MHQQSTDFNISKVGVALKNASITLGDIGKERLTDIERMMPSSILAVSAEIFHRSFTTSSGRDDKGHLNQVIFCPNGLVHVSFNAKDKVSGQVVAWEFMDKRELTVDTVPKFVHSFADRAELYLMIANGIASVFPPPTESQVEFVVRNTVSVTPLLDPSFAILKEIPSSLTLGAKVFNNLTLAMREADIERRLSESRQNSDIYLLQWRGDKSVYGTKVGDKLIGWTQSGIVRDLKGKPLGSYERLVSQGGRDRQENLMLVFIDKKLRASN